MKDQSVLTLWNFIYDPFHIDPSPKKGENTYLGVFKFYEGAYISINTLNEPYPLTVGVLISFCN